MLNMNDKMDYIEEADKSEKFEEDLQNQFEFYNPNYNVNYFGLGRGAEDWQ